MKRQGSVGVVGYIRVSSDEQVKEGVSLANQRAKIEAYAACKDLALIEIIEDAGESAKSLNRPGIQRIMSLIRSRKVSAVVIYKLDRLTRSVKDLGELVELLQKTGVDLMSVQESIDTSTAAGRMLLNLMATVSQWEREVIGERTADAMQHKRSLKEYTGGAVPYGWALDEDGVHLVPCDVEQAILQEALVLKEAGLSLRKVGERLEAKGLLPRSGGRWHAKTVRDLLEAQIG